jgi:type IV secretory pathway VirD2 relaxase
MSGFRPYLDANRNTKNPIIHISLNPHPDDALGVDDYARLSADYMERMGYGGQPYVAFLHEDIDRKHIHIVSVRVDAEGRKLKHAFERRRSDEIRRALEKEYELTPAAHRESTSLPLKKMDYRRGNIKAQAGGIVVSALEQYRFSTFGEFNALLKFYGLAA